MLNNDLKDMSKGLSLMDSLILNCWSTYGGVAYLIYLLLVDTRFPPSQNPNHD